MSDRPRGAEPDKIAEWDRKIAVNQAAWDQEMRESGINMEDPFMKGRAALAREVMYVGYWLGDRLAERHVSAEEVHNACAAIGQICLGRDPWLVARIFLSDFDEGIRYLPGEELADALLKGELSAHFGPGGEGRNPQELMRTLGVSSVEELMTRYGAASIEELRAKLEKMISD